MIGARLFASTGNFQNVMKERLANLLNAGFACCDGARVDIDQIGPSFRERRSRRNLDHRGHRQSIGSSPPRSEDMHVHRSGKLQRSTYKITRRSSGKDKPLAGDTLSWAKDSADGTTASLRDRTERLFHDIGQTTAFVPRRRIGA